MPEVQKAKRKQFFAEDYSDRDWIPRCCIKISTIHRDWLRSLLRSLIRARIEFHSPTFLISIDELDFLWMQEILEHVDNYRIIKSSVAPLTQYGGADNPDYHRPCPANSSVKKNLQ